jgi:hypothetical protein
MELAQWLTAPTNPLTARVMVNRIWLHHFGRGLVETPNDYGKRGKPPTHPELLDYLASEFVRSGWSLKAMHRLILLSGTWQRSAQPAPPCAQKDPTNTLLSHANRRRLDAEQIRDSILSISGGLDRRLGGPNITGAGDIDANNSSAQNIEYNYLYADVRRSVYTPAFRNKRLELFEFFDFGNINQTMGQRNSSTVAPQALFLLNHPFLLEQSKLAAETALKKTATRPVRIQTAYRQILGRPPSEKETAICERFLAHSTAPEAEVWAQLYQMLFASIDFRYID